MKGFLEKNNLNGNVIFPAVIVLSVILLIGIFSHDSFNAGIAWIYGITVGKLGWSYLLGGIFFLAFLVYLYFSPIGKIKFGGNNAIPIMSTFNWFAISLCTGIAIGILFWGVAEPLSHFASPPPHMGAEPNSAAATVAAMETSILHWGVTGYAFYTVFGIAIAFAAYNLGKPMVMSSAFYPIFGDKIYGVPSSIIDSLIVVCFIAGEMATLGFVSMQVAQGMNFVFGIPIDNVLRFSIIVIIGIICTISSVSGINRGIRILSDFNIKLFFFLMAFVLFFGPTNYIINLGLESLGALARDVIPMHLYTDANNVSGGWPGWWTIFYWAWYVIFGPTVGLFLAKISYGRSVRDFIFVTCIAPAVFTATWFVVMGGAALNMEFVQGLGLVEQMNAQGVPVTLFAMLQHLPLSVIVVPIALLVAIISFVTALDSALTTLGIYSSKKIDNVSEPWFGIKIIWAFLLVSLSIIFLVVSSEDVLQSLQTATIAAGFPIMLLGVFACVGTYYVIKGKGYRPENYDAQTFALKEENTVSK